MHILIAALPKILNKLISVLYNSHTNDGEAAESNSLEVKDKVST